MATFRGIPLSKISPAFLHANSTSHTWAFSAFAELIDNAYDPDVSASELLIDKIDINGIPCLIFLDNGAGMDSDHLLKMLSFGYCEKQAYERTSSHMPIGHYGNGFKSGSMRLGLDALVFTRCHSSASIGFLSQTYLKAIGTDSVVVPILTYRLPKLERIKSQESRNNLDAILKYSVFHTEQDLKEELFTLEGSVTGTKIILSNLKKLQDGRLELDFSSDETDIRCPEAHEVDLTSVYHRPIQQPSSEYKHSLKEYCSILFLRPRMKITIRGQRVRSKLISKSLSQTEHDSYKPTWLSRPLKITFGFTCEKTKSEDYGMMLYHRNRLIKPFEKVGYQKQPNDLGVGVVGVAQVDFLQPTHNKQDFNKDEKFNSVMAAFSTKLNDYWNEKKQNGPGVVEVTVRTSPDWLWAQCEQCLKWRRLPDGVRKEELAEQWFCRLNPDATHNRCEIPEEPEDEDLAVKPTYEKTFKRKQEERKRQQHFERQREEEVKRQRILAREKELKQKEAELMAFRRARNMNLPPPGGPPGPNQAPPSQGALGSLQRALAESQKREERHKRMLLQIQEEKRVMDERKKSILQLAESLKAGKGENGEDVIKKMSNLLGVQRNEPNSQSPQKRKQEANNNGARIIKRPYIKEEVMDSFPNGNSNAHLPAVSTQKAPTGNRDSDLSNDNANVPPGSVPTVPKGSKRKGSAETNLRPVNGEDNRGTTESEVIDLTEDGDNDIKPNVEELKAKRMRSEKEVEEEDVKPDKDELDASMQSKEKNPEKEKATPDKLPPKKEPPGKRVQEREEEGESAAEEEEEREGKRGKEATPRFGPSEDDPEFQMGSTDTFNSNLEAAMAAIMEKMSEEKLDELKKSGDAASNAHRNQDEQGEEICQEGMGEEICQEGMEADGTFDGKEQKKALGNEKDPNSVPLSAVTSDGNSIEEDDYYSESDIEEDDNFYHFNKNDSDEHESRGDDSSSSVQGGKQQDSAEAVETRVGQIVEDLISNVMEIVTGHQSTATEKHQNDYTDDEACSSNHSVEDFSHHGGTKEAKNSRSPSESTEDQVENGQPTCNALNSDKEDECSTDLRMSGNEDLDDSFSKGKDLVNYPVTPVVSAARYTSPNAGANSLHVSNQSASKTERGNPSPSLFSDDTNGARVQYSDKMCDNTTDDSSLNPATDGVGCSSSCHQFTQTEAEIIKETVENTCLHCTHKSASHKGCQTEKFGNESKGDAEKVAMRETIDNLRSKQEVKSKLLEQAEDRVKSLCQNVHRLLSFILPEMNLSEVTDTEQMITSMIKSHEESSMNMEEEEDGDQQVEKPTL